MMLSSRALFAGGLAALLAGGAHPALAQGASSRPFRGLFGSASEENARHKLDARVSLTAAYDSDVPGEAKTVGLTGLESVGHSTVLVTGVEYAWQRRRVQFQGGGVSAVRYYPALDEIRTVSHMAHVGLIARLPARTIVQANQTGAYTPSYLYNLFPRIGATPPGDAPPASPDYAVNGAEAYSYGTSTTLAYNVLGRNSLLTTAERQRTESSTAAGGVRHLDVYGLLGQYSRRLGRNTVASASYRYRVGDVAQGGSATANGTLTEHGVEVGMDYRRPLSASRQLTVDGRFGSAALLLPESVRAVSVRREPYRLLGDVAIGYQFRRAWQVRATYRRGVEYVAGLAEPVSTDGLTTTVDGWLGRRIDMLASVAYSSGESTWNPTSIRFDTYMGNGRLRYTLTRTLSAYVEYLYYFYDFRGTTQLGPGIPQRLERNGGRAGFTVNLPVLRSR